MPSKLLELFPIEERESELLKLFPLEEPSFLGDVWEGIKKSPQMYYDALQKITQTATDPQAVDEFLFQPQSFGTPWIRMAKLTPGSEGLPDDWEDLSLAQKVEVRAKVLGLGMTALSLTGGGMSFLEATRKALGFKRAIKKMPIGRVVDAQKALKARGRTLQWATGYTMEGKPYAGWDIGRIPKGEVPNLEIAAKQFSQAIVKHETLSRDAYRASVYDYLSQLFKPVQIQYVPSKTVMPKVVEALDQALIGVPETFSPRLASEVTKNLFGNLLPLKIAELSSQYAPKPFKTITNLDHLSTFLDNAGLDVKAKNLMYQAVRKGRGVVDDITIQAIADDSIRREIESKSHLYPGELDAYVAYRETLAEELRGAVRDWRTLEEKKVMTGIEELPEVTKLEDYDIRPGSFPHYDAVKNIIYVGKFKGKEKLAVAAHEIAHKQLFDSGQRETGKDLEIRVWHRGQEIARDFGVFDEYMKMPPYFVDATTAQQVLGAEVPIRITVQEPSLLQAERTKLMLKETRQLAREHRLSSMSVSRIMQIFTGKKDVRKLSEDEFEIVKGAMEEWGILFDKEVQQLDLIKKKYRGATPLAIGLPAFRVFDLIGAREIHDRVEEPYVTMYVEMNNLYGNLKDWWKVVKGRGVKGKVFRSLNNTLLPNEVLNPQELIVAQKMREITDSLADRMELSPEKRRENYIYNMFDAIARKEISGKHPVPLEAQDAFRYGVPKDIFTPTLLERLGRKEGLVEDAWKAMRALIAIDLRYIHLDPVLKEIAPEINAWPNRTARKYMQDWMEYAVLKRHTPIDDMINDVLNPFNKFITKATKGKISLGTNPAKTLGYLYTKAGYGGVMAFNIAVAIKNMTQQLLIPPLLSNPMYYFGAWKDFFTPQGKELLKESLTLTARFPMESFDPHQIGTWLQKGMAFYRLVDYVNVSTAFLSGYREATKKLGYSHGMAVKYADRLAKISQYSYRPIDMPEFMWKGGAPGRIAGMLQTWQINYFGNYLPELTYRLMTGKDTEGNPVSKYQRAGLLRHMIITGTFIYLMRKYAKVDFKRIFGPGVMNTQLGPSINLLIGLGAAAVGTVGGDYRLKKWGTKQIGKVFPTMFVPAGLQIKKIGRAYQEAAEGLKRDRYGRPVMDVTLDTVFKSIFAQPTATTRFWDAQQKVWELDDRMKTFLREAQAAHMKGDRRKEDKIRDKLVKLAKERGRWQQDLAKIRRGEIVDKGMLKEIERILLP